MLLSSSSVSERYPAFFKPRTEDILRVHAVVPEGSDEWDFLALVTRAFNRPIELYTSTYPPSGMTNEVRAATMLLETAPEKPDIIIAGDDECQVYIVDCGEMEETKIEGPMDTIPAKIAEFFPRHVHQPAGDNNDDNNDSELPSFDDLKWEIVNSKSLRAFYPSGEPEVIHATFFVGPHDWSLPEHEMHLGKVTHVEVILSKNSKGLTFRQVPLRLIPRLMAQIASIPQNVTLMNLALTGRTYTRRKVRFRNIDGLDEDFVNSLAVDMVPGEEGDGPEPERPTEPIAGLNTLMLMAALAAAESSS